MNIEESVAVDDFHTVSRNAIAKDVNSLVFDFQRQQKHTFATFKQLWDTRQFVYIHLCCCSHDARELVMQEIFCHFLKWTIYRRDLPLKLGGLFGLYCVYMTQPKRFTKYRIQIPPRAWNILASFAETLQALDDDSAKDGRFMLSQMMYKEYAFELVPEVTRLSELIMFMRKYDRDGAFPEREGLSRLVQGSEKAAAHVLLERFESMEPPEKVLQDLFRRDDPQHPYTRYVQARDALSSTRPDILMPIDMTKLADDLDTFEALLSARPEGPLDKSSAQSDAEETGNDMKYLQELYRDLGSQPQDQRPEFRFNSMPSIGH